MQTISLQFNVGYDLRISTDLRIFNHVSSSGNHASSPALFTGIG